MRRCLSEPIAQIAEAAEYLSAAVSAHLKGDFSEADALLRRADMPELYAWLRPIWGNSSVHLLPTAKIEQLSLSKELRSKERMPNASLKAQIHQRDGYNCRFCGMPVIRREIRTLIRAKYPAALRWGNKDAEHHTAFMVMWAQYDHVVPHAYGGTNDLANIVLACAACNFGRAAYTLEQVGVSDPRLRNPVRGFWNGLEGFR
jgi:hypothetical protein